MYYFIDYELRLLLFASQEMWKIRVENSKRGNYFKFLFALHPREGQIDPKLKMIILGQRWQHK